MATTTLGAHMTKRVIAAVLTAGLLLAGCGNGGGKGDELTLVQGAGAAVLAQKTARAEMHTKIAGQDIVMTGELDFEHKASSLTMSIPVLGKVDIVSSGSNLYIRREGSGWNKIEMTGGLGEQALQGLIADPRSMLGQVAGADRIKDEGTVDIRGVVTTHYSGQVDLVKALQAQGIPAAQIDQVKAQADASTLVSTVDVYLDDSGLAHRTISHTKVGSLDISMTLDLLDFGAPVTITIPAPSEVVLTQSASNQYEASQLLQSILSGTAG